MVSEKKHIKRPLTDQNGNKGVYPQISRVGFPFSAIRLVATARPGKVGEVRFGKTVVTNSLENYPCSHEKSHSKVCVYVWKMV